MIPLQIEAAGTKLLDYGVIGIALVFVGFFAWYLFKKQEKNADEWRDQSKKMSESFITLVTKQNETNQRLIDIREKDHSENKEFHEDISKKVDELPEKFIKEFEYRQLRQQNINNTPA